MLRSGKSTFEWTADGKFFADWGNPDITAASLKIKGEANGHGITADVRCSMEGTVTVPCDRCLDNLTLSVSASFEESYVLEDEDELDLSQDIYDYVCTSLPMQRMHENEEECNRETLKYLSKNK